MDSDSKSIKNSRRRSVNKKVSFSMIEGAYTFDEIAKMRKIKEKQLENFILNKKRTNQYISSLKPKNIIPSNNYENNINNKNKEEINNTNNNMNNNSSINSSSVNVNVNINNMKKSINHKRQMPIRFYLTDEEESKVSNTFLSQNNNIINNKNNIINNNIGKFIKIISDIFNMKYNKNKKREIKRKAFNEIINYNNAIIKNDYLNEEDNDIEHKNFLENKKLFFIKKKAYENLLKKIKEIHYMKLINKKIMKKQKNSIFIHYIRKK